MDDVRVNGEAAALDGVPSHTSALTWLRDRGLTGAKEGCAEGECGACSVLVSRPRTDGSPGAQWTAINSCLLPAAALSGREVITAEGLGTLEHLHPVQRELAERGGSQCGYCTPGFVCSLAAEYYRPGRADVDVHAVAGNLCRCTGYRPIHDAALALGHPAPADPLATPAGDLAPAPVRRPGFARPATLTETLDLLAGTPGAVLVAGSTDWGVEANLRGARTPLVIAIDALPELRGLTIGDDVVEIGAGLTLSEMEARLDGALPLLDLVFPLFASPLIRNAATLGGNLATASPIGDSAPALLALEASVEIVGPWSVREVPLADFFTGYRTTALGAGEVIRSIRVPRRQPTLIGFHKIAKRRLDDISSVAVAFALDLDGDVVRRARIGLGGVAATPVRATATEAALEGGTWGGDLVDRAAEVLATEGTPMDDHRASAAYRSAMLGQSLRKLFHQSGQEQPA